MVVKAQELIELIQSLDEECDIDLLNEKVYYKMKLYEVSEEEAFDIVCNYYQRVKNDRE